MRTNKLLLMAGMLAVSMNAFAGWVNPVPVEIDLTIHRASGNMGTARFAEDDVTFIGCGKQFFKAEGMTEAYTRAFCQARDAAEVSVRCFTEDLELIAALDAISHNSYLSFSWTPDIDEETGEPTPEYGTCEYIGVSTQSQYILDFKTKSKSK